MHSRQVLVKGTPRTRWPEWGRAVTVLTRWATHRTRLAPEHAGQTPVAQPGPPKSSRGSASRFCLTEERGRRDAPIRSHLTGSLRIGPGEARRHLPTCSSAQSVPRLPAAGSKQVNRPRGRDLSPELSGRGRSAPRCAGPSPAGRGRRHPPRGAGGGAGGWAEATHGPRARFGVREWPPQPPAPEF